MNVFDCRIVVPTPKRIRARTTDSLAPDVLAALAALETAAASVDAGDQIQVLTSIGPVLAKVWDQHGIRAEAHARQFRPALRHVTDLRQWFDLYLQHRENRTACFIRARSLGHDACIAAGETNLDAGCVARRVSLAADVPLHSLSLDLDSVVIEGIDAVRDPVAAIERWIVGHLPAAFHGADYCYYQTGSAGHPGKPGLRARVTFWLTVALDSAQADAMLDHFGVTCVDRAALRPVQPHFTALPIFLDGTADPVSPAVRAGYIDKGRPQVMLDWQPPAAGASSTGATARHAHDGTDDDVLEWLDERGMVCGEQDAQGRVPVICPNEAQHSSGKRGDGSTAWMRAGTGGFEVGGFKCQHEHCRDLTTPAYLDRIGYYVAQAGFGQCAPPPGASSTPIPPAPTAEHMAALNDARAGLEPWGEPRPLDIPLAAVPTFDPAVALPEPLAAYVADEARRMNVPTEMVAIPVVVTLGSLIGTQVVMRPKGADSWIIVPNLWGATVAPPGSKKSASQAAATKPLAPLIAKARAEHTASRQSAEIDEMMAKAKIEEIEKRLKDIAKGKPKDGDTALDLRSALAQAKEELAALRVADERRFTFGDATPEKVAIMIAANPPGAGLLALHDELAGMFGGFERDGHEQERALYLTGWNGDSRHEVDRVSRESFVIERLTLSVQGGTQPDVLHEYLERYATSIGGRDGFMARLQLLIYPDQPEPAYVDEAPDLTVLGRMEAVYARLAQIDPIAIGASPPGPGVPFWHVRFAGDAQARWRDWSVDLERRVAAEERSLIAEHLAKYPKLVGGLALIFHLIECPRVRQDAPQDSQVSLGNLERAIGWARLLEAHARRVYGLLYGGGQGAAVALAAKIKAGRVPDNFTARWVIRNDWSKLHDQKRVEEAVETLVEHGWLREIPGATGPRGGRPKASKFEIHPNLPKPTKPNG
jgi:hypothetical protein